MSSGGKKPAEEKGHGGGGHKKHGHGGGGHGEEVNLERWLVSYADFMTLLFCVFVMLFAMSKVDETKVQEVAQSVTEALLGSEFAVFDGVGQLRRGGLLDGSSEILPFRGSFVDRSSKGCKEKGRQKFVEETNKLKESLQGAVQGLKEAAKGGGLDEKVMVETVPGIGVRVSFPESLSFKTGQTRIQRRVLPLLDNIAELIKNIPNKILVEGHTDNVPTKGGQFNSNWELSVARATTVLRYFLFQHKIEPERMSAAGYGEYHPLFPNDTEENRKKNRRVDIIVVVDNLFEEENGANPPGYKPSIEPKK